MSNISLYILVDFHKRIYYTGSNIKDVEEFQKTFNVPNLQIIELKGEMNESSSPSRRNVE